MSIQIKQISDSSFRRYGRIIEGYDCAKVIKLMEEIEIPENVVYIGSVAGLEQAEVAKAFEENFFGNMPIQCGYCIGHNSFLNAMEYHRNSEINIAVTDLILLLGAQQDIEEDYTYDTSKVEAYFVPAGKVVELYATTLHYAPCNAGEDGFSAIVILPKGTNEEYVAKKNDLNEENKLLFACNKWLIAHKDAQILGAFNGLKGENISIL